MGRIHTLYYLQVQRSLEDAKKERREQRKKRERTKNKKEPVRTGPSNGNVLENRRLAQQFEEMLEEES